MVNRINLFDFDFVFLDSSTPIIFRQPPLSAISNIFILPLDWLVWYCYGAMVLIVILVMAIQFIHPALRAEMKFFDIPQFVVGIIINIYWL